MELDNCISCGKCVPHLGSSSGEVDVKSVGVRRIVGHRGAQAQEEWIMEAKSDVFIVWNEEGRLLFLILAPLLVSPLIL